MQNTNYKWVISAMDCKVKEGTLENIVNVIHWRLNASDGTYTTETYGLVTTPEPSETDFTPYENLTKEQVVSWVVDILNVVPEPIDGIQQLSQLDTIKESLNKDLLLKKNPIKVNLPLPFENE